MTPRDANDVTSRDGDPIGVELGDAGLNLWREMTKQGALPPMQAVLLLEACRITDRLEKLDRQLAGEDWLRFRVDDDGTEVTVVIDKPLSEARQQATALKQIMAELRQASAGSKAPGRPSAESRAAETKKSGGTGGTISDLAAHAAKRGSASAS